MTNVNSVVVSQPDKAVDALMNVIVKGVKSCTACPANGKDNTFRVTDSVFVLQWTRNQKGKKRKERKFYYHLDPLIVNIKRDWPRTDWQGLV